MKKRSLLALLLAFCLCFSLAACVSENDGGQTTPAATSASPEPAESAQPSDPAESDNPSAEPEASEPPAADAESDLAYVQNKGTLVVGITNFAPMDYPDENGEWIGFDADMAKLFAESLGVEVEFVEITWDYKIMELDSKQIDCVWNGMTLTDEVTSAMSTSVPYCRNAQVVVVPADVADQYQTPESLSGLNIAVESGSAGEAAAQALGAVTIPVPSQANTLLEVQSGTADAAVIDLLMAGAMIGEGTSYESLTYTINLNGEEYEQYGVGFRQGSDLTAAFNAFWAEKVADGTALELATQYGVQESVILE